MDCHISRRFLELGPMGIASVVELGCSSVQAFYWGATLDLDAYFSGYTVTERACIFVFFGDCIL